MLSGDVWQTASFGAHKDQRGCLATLTNNPTPTHAPPGHHLRMNLISHRA